MSFMNPDVIGEMPYLDTPQLDTPQLDTPQLDTPQLENQPTQPSTPVDQDNLAEEPLVLKRTDDVSINVARLKEYLATSIIIGRHLQKELDSQSDAQPDALMDTFYNEVLAKFTKADDQHNINTEQDTKQVESIPAIPLEPSQQPTERTTEQPPIKLPNVQLDKSNIAKFTYKETIDFERAQKAQQRFADLFPDNYDFLARVFLGTINNLQLYCIRKAEKETGIIPETLECPDLKEFTNVCEELPGINSTRGEMAKELAYAFMNTLHSYDITSTSDVKDRKFAYVHYTKLKSMLKRAYAEQQTAKNASKNQPYNYGMCKLSKYHKARMSVSYYEEAKSLPLSEQILKPTPMEVEIAPISELQAFFDRLAANENALPVKSDEIGSYEQYARGAYYTDGRIDLCKQVVGPDHIGKLCDAIRYNQHVKHFLLGNNIAGYIGAACIASLISDPKKKCRISTWYLAGNCIDGPGMELIAGALTNDTDCKHLWLKRNPIGVQGAKAIAKMLETNNTIEVIDLDNTAIFDEGCIAIFKALLKNTSVRSIYLDANGLTEASSQAIADYFQYKVGTKQQGIKQLSLSINRLGDEGIKPIIESLYGYPLNSLTIGSNRIELAGLTEVIRWACYPNTMANLEVLDIGYYKATADMGELPNSFGDEGARLIACFILLNTPVRYLSFHNTHITDLSIIDAVMPFNTNLISVTCEQGTTSSKVVHKVAERNSARLYPDKSPKEIVRNMKHGADVWVIDSIYRNKM